MEIDTDKIDDAVLALRCLTRCDDTLQEGTGTSKVASPGIGNKTRLGASPVLPRTAELWH